MHTHVRSRVLQFGQWPPLEILFKGGPGVSAKGGAYIPAPLRWRRLRSSGVAQRGSRAQRLLSAGARTRVYATALGADVSGKGLEDSHVRCVLSAFG